MSHAHKSWYLLGTPFNISDEHHCHFYIIFISVGMVVGGGVVSIMTFHPYGPISHAQLLNLSSSNGDIFRTSSYVLEMFSLFENCSSSSSHSVDNTRAFNSEKKCFTF